LDCFAPFRIMRLMAKSPTAGRPFDRWLDGLVATFAAVLLVGLPTGLLFRNEPIDAGQLSVVTLSMSVIAAILGGTLPGVFAVSFRSVLIERVARAAGAFALFVLTFVSVPMFLVQFDAPSWLGASSAVAGLGSLLAAILTSVAATSAAVLKKWRQVASVDELHEMKVALGKTTLSQEDTEKVIRALKRIEASNTSIQTKMSDAGNATKTEGG